MVCSKCSSPMTPAENVSYNGRCENCFAGVFCYGLVTGQSPAVLRNMISEIHRKSRHLHIDDDE